MTDDRKELLNHPEVQDLIENHLNQLLQESDRGAVIVGADILDAKLRQLLEAQFIEKLSNKKKKDIFDFSGPLGSLSSKINLAYSFGFTNEMTRNAAHALREIRNLAAHSNASFSLKENYDLIRRVYNLGDNIPPAVNSWAMELLVKDMVYRALDFQFEDGRSAFETPAEVLDYFSENPELLEPLDEKIFRTEFSLGLVLLCAVVIHQVGEEKRI